MMKTGKSTIQAAKASGSSVDSSLAYPNTSLKVSSCGASSQVKSKLKQLMITTSILKQGGATASPRPLEASNGLANGLVQLACDESAGEKSSQRRNFPKDITDFGLFQKRHQGGTGASSDTGETLRNMYSLSEETGERGSSDAEKDKEGVAGGEEEKGLMEGGREEEEAGGMATAAVNQNTEDGRAKEAEDKESTEPCCDSAAASCSSPSPRD